MSLLVKNFKIRISKQIENVLNPAEQNVLPLFFNIYQTPMMIPGRSAVQTNDNWLRPDGIMKINGTR